MAPPLCELDRAPKNHGGSLAHSSSGGGRPLGRRGGGFHGLHPSQPSVTRIVISGSGLISSTIGAPPGRRGFSIDPGLKLAGTFQFSRQNRRGRGERTRRTRSFFPFLFLEGGGGENEHGAIPRL